MSHPTPSAATPDSQPEDIFKSTANLLLKVVVVTAVVVGILIALAVMVAPEHSGPYRAEMTEKAVVARIQKVGVLSFGEAPASGPRSAEDLYLGRCAGCHTAGLLGAPKLGDKAGWAARIATGFDAMLNSALKGKKAMPAQGGGDYSDAEVGRALVYLVNASGASFVEPKSQATPAAK
jgi:cytochrome c5